MAGFLEQQRTLTRLKEVTGNKDVPKIEQVPAAEPKELTSFQKTLQRMQEIAAQTIAEEKKQAEIAAKQQAEQSSAQADQAEYKSVLDMINRQLAAGGNRDAVTSTAHQEEGGVKVSPSNQAFLEGKGQGR